jgi:hypothetical protein
MAYASVFQNTTALKLQSMPSELRLEPRVRKLSPDAGTIQLSGDIGALVANL